jgi:hypothetical protein
MASCRVQEGHPPPIVRRIGVGGVPPHPTSAHQLDTVAAERTLSGEANDRPRKRPRCLGGSQDSRAGVLRSRSPDVVMSSTEGDAVRQPSALEQPIQRRVLVGRLAAGDDVTAPAQDKQCEAEPHSRHGPANESGIRAWRGHPADPVKGQ